MQLRDLIADTESTELLALHYDFDVNADLSGEPWFSIEGAAIVPIAGDAAGGVFALCRLVTGRQGFVYVSSEGQGGLVAEGLGEWLAIMAALPYWFDLLKFSSGGKLDEMRRVQPLLVEDTVEDNPELLAMEGNLRQRLQLPEIDDPVARLHRHVSGGLGAAILRTADGTALNSLFNSFRLENNPSWRGGSRPPQVE